MKRKRDREPVLDLESVLKLRREVEKIPPQQNERSAKSLANLKAAIDRLEAKAKARSR